MTNRISTVGTKGRDEAFEGIRYVAKAVKSTIGPFGQNFLLEKGKKVTNDGFTVSQQLCNAIKNEFQRLSAQAFHEICAKTNYQVGDFTSGSWALGEAILFSSLKQLQSEKTLVGKMTPSDIITTVEKERVEVIEKLKAMVVPVETEEQLISSALVSTENEELASLIGKMQWELGSEGMIVAEETAETKCSIQRVKGILIDNGMGAPIMMNNLEKQSLEISDCSVIMTNHTLGEEQLLKLKETIFVPLMLKGQNRIVIIARAFTADAIKLCQASHGAGLFLYPINAPYTDQGQIMRDIVAVLGGNYIEVEGGNIEDLQLSDVGYATKIEARRFDAIITGVDDEKSAIRVAKRVEELTQKLAGEMSDFQKKAIETRLAQLTNGFALLKVGAPTDVSRKRLKDKADDAVMATRLALKGGTVPGAGLAFKQIAETMPDGSLLKIPLTCVNDQIMLTAPKDFTVPEWVRDPFLVLECGLKNACDGATQFATIIGLEAAENPKKYKEVEMEE